jgi:hypothetical protein
MSQLMFKQGENLNPRVVCKKEQQKRSWITDLVRVFQDASNKYTREHTSVGDRPCFFGRATGGEAYNTEELPKERLPTGVFMTHDWM